MEERKKFVHLLDYTFSLSDKANEIHETFVFKMTTYNKDAETLEKIRTEEYLPAKEAWLTFCSGSPERNRAQEKLEQSVAKFNQKEVEAKKLSSGDEI